MSRKFSPYDIYHLYCGRGNMQLDKAVEAGMIPKKDLIDGVTYVGHCRNAEEATWNASLQVFIYKRHKFGETFKEEINHPEDDIGFDVFIPVGKK